MKKMLLGLGVFAALMAGFFSVVPLKKANAYTWYTVYEYTQKECAGASLITNECIGEINPPDYSFTPNTINLASHPTAACPLPPATPASGTNVIAYKLTGSHASQVPGISCIVGPGI